MKRLETKMAKEEEPYITILNEESEIQDNH